MSSELRLLDESLISLQTFASFQWITFPWLAATDLSRTMLYMFIGSDPSLHFRYFFPGNEKKFFWASFCSFAVKKVFNGDLKQCHLAKPSLFSCTDCWKPNIAQQLCWNIKTTTKLYQIINCFNSYCLNCRVA